MDETKERHFGYWFEKYSSHFADQNTARMLFDLAYHFGWYHGHYGKEIPLQ